METIKDNDDNLTAGEKQKLYRIRKKTLKTIDDLNYLANNLPEKQLKQIFNDSTVNPLMAAILHRPDADKKRICRIVVDLIGSVLGDVKFASRIVPKKAGFKIPKNEEDPSKVVEALFFAAMCSE